MDPWHSPSSSDVLASHLLMMILPLIPRLRSREHLFIGSSLVWEHSYRPSYYQYQYDIATGLLITNIFINDKIVGSLKSGIALWSKV